MKKLVFRTILIGAAFLAVAGPVLANDSFYNWTMNFRIVNPNGGPLHTMEGGWLTNRGQVWPYSTDAGHTPSPAQLHIQVYRENTVTNAVCTTLITPNKQFNVGKQYTSANCAFIAAGNYWVQIWKTNDDGWNEKGQGDLVTP